MTRLILGSLVIVVAFLVLLVGYVLLNEVGINTREGMATVTYCRHDLPSTTIDPITSSTPERWIVGAKIESEEASFHADAVTCGKPAGSTVLVRYGVGRISNRLVIVGLAL